MAGVKMCQDLDGASSLPPTVFSFGGLLTMAGGTGWDGADRTDAEGSRRVA